MKARNLALACGIVTCWLTLLPAGRSAVVPGQATGEPLQGKFLVAQPQVNDPRFERSVVLVIDHSTDGAMGLVINKQMGDLQASEILEGLGLQPLDQDRTLKILFGGPVELDHGFILHSTDLAVETSREVAEGVAFSADAETVRLLLTGKGPGRYRIAFGYAGWAPGQLERELERGDWRVLPSDSEIIFSDEPDKSWDRLMGDQVFHM